MDNQNRATDLEELLQHASWVKNLAYASLRDYALAEDVSQEVLLKAIAEPQRSGRVLRAWLAAVTRNMARNEIRGLMRRRAREQKVAEREARGADGDPTEINLMHAHRELTFIVESLSPKHREVIVQRFFEERSFKQISRHLKISEGNVRIRLHRALEELRQQMQERNGDWRASCLLIAPAAAFPTSQLTLPTAPKLLTVASAVVLIGSVVLWNWEPGVDLEPSTSTLLTQVDAAEHEYVAIPSDDFPVANPTTLERETIILESTSALEQLEHVGIVLFNGYPVAGAQVVIGQSCRTTRTATAADGTFVITMPASGRGMVSAYSNGRCGRAEFDDATRFPDVINLYEPRKTDRRLTVVDGVTKEGIPEARVQVYANWFGDWEDVVSNSCALEFLAEYVTDSEGHYPCPEGVRPEWIESRASAPGYLSGRSVGKKVTLLPGNDLVVQLIRRDGSPLANVEVATGHVARIRSTDINGMIQGITSWSRVVRDESFIVVPSVLSVRLSDGRFWQLHEESVLDDGFRMDGDVLQITVDESPIHVELLEFPLEEGSYVEAMTWVGFQFWTSIDEDSPWQRLESGQTALLEKGLVNSNHVVARLMPAASIIGYFPVVDGKATIDSEIIPFKLTMVGPSVTAGKALTVKIYGEYLLGEFPSVDGVARGGIPNSSEYRCMIIDDLSNAKLFLEDPGKTWTQDLTLKPQDGKVEVTIRELDSKTRPVLIRVNGLPVSGGSYGGGWGEKSRAIDRFGMVEFSFSPQGEPILGGTLNLDLPGEVFHQGGGTALTAFKFHSDSDIPGVFHQLADGKTVWDLELTFVELWVPPGDYGWNRQLQITKGAAVISLTNIRTGGYSNGVLVPPEGDWFAFRIPAGNYAFQVGDFTYGGSGVDLLGGQVTQLQPDPGE